jgi:ABC-type transporter Mla MlaB component
MSKDAGQFLRKVVKFVANPATDWAELDAPAVDSRESEYAKAEIKAMIERKRRNDFVRKRELDMLRKIRREGLNHDNALALTTPSNLDSRTNSGSGHPSGARSDIAVKAKIDEIEQQMVGSGEGRQSGPSSRPGLPVHGSVSLRDLPLNLDLPPGASPTQALPFASSVPATEPGQTQPSPSTLARHDTLPTLSMMVPAAFQNPNAMAVSEMVLDPELDEAVMAFANADFEQCERTLLALIQPGGARHDHAESWLVLFDFYRALDMQAKYDGLATWFAHQFSLSAPQWYSLPEQLAKHLGKQAPTVGQSTSGLSQAEETARALDPDEPLEGWIAPGLLDAEAVGLLRCEVLQMPRPWVMDWHGVQGVTPEAAGQLVALLSAWAKEPLALVWVGIDHLLTALAEMSPTGSRDADPALWMLRLEILRLCNRPDQFDEVAIDYCVTYEQSPPSWEPTPCSVKLMSDATCTQTMPLTHIGEVSTSFVESQLLDEAEYVQHSSLELSGQLSGDIGAVLAELDAQLGASVIISLDCSHLIRIDFVAAGDLLNWVLTRRTENRTVDFVNPHRLIALFLGAMGITEHAKVKLQMA